MLADAILMAIPDQYKNEYLAGAIYRVGALLFRKGEPGIIAHITEAQGLAPAAALLLKANPVLGMANLGLTGFGQVVGVIQNEQIKAALSTLQVMQLGSTVLGGVGIGVSIVSAVMLSRKIERVVDQVSALDSKLERIAKAIDELKAEVVAEDFDRLRTACQRVDEAWRLSDPEPQWRSAAEELHGLQNRFARRLRRIIVETREVEAIEPFVDALALAGSTRISSRLAAGDMVAAEHAALSSSREFAEITEPIGTASLTARQLGNTGILPGASNYAYEVERFKSTAEAQTSALREREEMAATVPLVIRRLAHDGISGRYWLERARSETYEPFLIYPVTKS